MIRVGPAGWSYPDWDGPVHPRPRPRGYHGLELLAGVFDCVEINSSFYRLPRPEHCRDWLQRTAAQPRFRFTAKLHQDFTHRREQRFGTPRELEAGLTEFRAALAPLLESPRCAALLLQFPFSFSPGIRERRYLGALLAATRDLHPVLELRQRAWYGRDHLRAIEAAGASLALIDLPAAKDHPPADFEGLGPIGYLRLHGRNSAAWFDPAAGRDERYRYAYARSELVPLARSIERLAARSDATYAIANNHFGGQAIAAGVELLDLVGQPPQDLPAHWLEHFPALSAIAGPRPAGDLFG